MRRKKNLIFAIAVPVVIAAVIAAVVLIRNTPARRLQRQLDLGNRYLAELRYEDAIGAFETVLMAEPGNVAAYRGLIETYEGTADIAAIEDLLLRAREAGLSSEDLQRIEQTAQRALARLGSADGENANVVSSAGDGGETAPVPGEYRSIIQALRELRHMQFLDIPLPDWTAEDMDAYIAANGLVETGTDASGDTPAAESIYHYLPPGAPYPYETFYYAVTKHTDWWSIVYYYNVNEDGEWLYRPVAWVSLSFGEHAWGERGAGYYAGMGGVDRFGGLSSWETFFGKHDGQALYQYISEGGGEFTLEDGTLVSCYLSGADIQEGFHIDIYEPEGKLGIWFRQSNFQCWEIQIYSG